MSSGAQSNALLFTPPAPAKKDEVLQKAIQQYINTLSDDDRAAFRTAPDIIEHLQKIQCNGKTLINSSLTSRVEKVLQCVKTFMGSLVIFIQQSPEISSLVVGGVNCILMLVLGYIEFFERLTGMMERIGIHLSYLTEYCKPTFQELEKLQEALGAAYCDLLGFYVKARQVFINKKGKPSYFEGFKLFFRLTWEPFEAQFGSIEARFSNHTIAIVRLANIDYQHRALEHQDQLLKYQNQALEYQNQVLEYQKREGEIRKLEADSKSKKEAYKMHRKILEWLSPDDFEDTHERHFKKRFEGTGQWLLNDFRFITWREETQSSLLWCYGAPGSGKTVLASLVIEHLSALYELSADTGITFVYCNYMESRTTMAYIRLALKQLCRTMQSLPPKLQEVYEWHYRNNSQPGYAELKIVFLAIIQQFGRIFLVLDALDECAPDQRKDLCEFLLDLAGTPSTSTVPSQGSVKLFVTSRKESDIERAFQQKSIPTIEIEAAKVNRDITYM